MNHVSKMSVSKQFLDHAQHRLLLSLSVFAALCALSITPAHAVTPTWQAEEVNPVNDGTGRVLWVKQGTYNGSGVYSGDTISIWALNAAGKATAMGPSYTAGTGWVEQDFSTGPDGTNWILWVKQGTFGTSGTYTGDTVALWTFNAGGVATVKGPAYGPYAGWRNVGDAVGGGSSSLFWRKEGTTGTDGTYSGDSVAVWTLNSADKETSMGTTYTYGIGWRGYPGTTNIFWYKLGKDDANGVYSGEAVAFWNLNAVGTVTTKGPVYGPFTGWRTGFFQPIDDGTYRLFWKKDATLVNGVDTTGESLSVWALNAQGTSTSAGPAYSIGAGWTPQESYVTPNGITHVLWIKTGATNNAGTYLGDTASIWALDATGKKTSAGPNYGPFAGWTADSLGIAPDGTSRINWTKVGTYQNDGSYSGDAISIWTFNATGTKTAAGPTYGPYTGWQTNFAYPASNILTYQVWVHSDPSLSSDQFTVWSLDGQGKQTSSGPVYGPY